MTTEQASEMDWAAPPKGFSLAETSEITGLSRSTLERMLREGMPYIKAADRNRRKEWELCIGDVIAFRSAQKRKEHYDRECRRQGLQIDPATQLSTDREALDMTDDLILQARDFLAAISHEASAKRRAAMVANFNAVIDRLEIVRGKEP